MFIGVCSFKGGAGKTRIASCISAETGYDIVTNDMYSPLEKFFNENRILKLHPEDKFPNFDTSDNIIFDFGGYSDPRIKEVLKKCSYIIVPIINDEDDIQVAVNY